MLLCKVCYGAVTFDGTDDQIKTGTVGASSTLTSLSCFIKLDAQPGTDAREHIINVGTTSNKPNAEVSYQDVGGTKRIYVGFKNTADNDWISWYRNITLSNDVWYHLAITIDSSTNPDEYYLYVDGIQYAMTATDVTNSDRYATSPVFTIGQNPDDGQPPIDGIVAEVAYWNGVVLTQSEVTSLDSCSYRQPLQVQASNLEAYFEMNISDGTSADGDTFTDLSGNSNDGTGNDGGNNTGLMYTVGPCQAHIFNDLFVEGGLYIEADATTN